MNFLDAVKQGMCKAREADAATCEVNTIFAAINLDLARFDESVTLKLARTVSTVASIKSVTSFFTEVTSEYAPEDVIQITVTTQGASTTSVIAKWRQHTDGFPCVLSFEGEEFTCTTGDDLRAAFSELFSTASFGRALVASLE